jgi:hypothetical protein
MRIVYVGIYACKECRVVSDKPLTADDIRCTLHKALITSHIRCTLADIPQLNNGDKGK